MNKNEWKNFHSCYCFGWIFSLIFSRVKIFGWKPPRGSQPIIPAEVGMTMI